MSKKEPAWREKRAFPGSLHESFLQKLDIPVYLRRWLVVYGNKDPDKMMGEILEQAVLLHIRSFQRVAAYAGHKGWNYQDNLVAGRYVKGNEAVLCAAMQESERDLKSRFDIRNTAMVVCVSNGVYGYFFAVDTADFKPGKEDLKNPGPFLTWVMGEWNLREIPRKNLDGIVIRLEKGAWPVHPRLIPGHPWAGKTLEFTRGFDEELPF